MENNNESDDALKKLFDLVYAEKFYMHLFIAEQGLNGEYTKWLHQKMQLFNSSGFKSSEEQ